METNIRVYSVRDISIMAKRAIEGFPAFSSIAVRGEVCNRSNGTGHLYFSLKEGDEIVRCITWSSTRQGLAARGVEPRDGMSVVCIGRITTYSGNSIYQLQVTDVVPEGAGAAALAFEALKNRLEAEGLFAQKRVLPKYPKKIAVITSPDGDALRDITTNVLHRYPLVELCLYPAAVQGQTAPPSIINAFREAQDSGADIIIFGRGGGSREDLNCFDDEGVARAIFASRIPTISAVGHENDFTIGDFVADQRASTPTGAAVIAVPSIVEILKKIETDKNRAASKMELELAKNNSKLLELSKKIEQKSPRGKIAAWSAQLDSVEVRIKTGIHKRLDKSEQALRLTANTINGVNPLAVLSRGYSVTTKDGKAIKSSKELSVGDVIDVRLNEGKVTAEVRTVDS